MPGQATAYMIGNPEIRRLREGAKQKLGTRFEIKKFHDLVLEDGSMPLWGLKEKVERCATEELRQKSGCRSHGGTEFTRSRGEQLRVRVI